MYLFDGINNIFIWTYQLLMSTIFCLYFSREYNFALYSAVFTLQNVILKLKLYQWSSKKNIKAYVSFFFKSKPQWDKNSNKNHKKYVSSYCSNKKVWKNFCVCETETVFMIKQWFYMMISVFRVRNVKGILQTNKTKLLKWTTPRVSERVCWILK